jgi:hypothetical protein
MILVVGGLVSYYASTAYSQTAYILTLSVTGFELLIFLATALKNPGIIVSRKQSMASHDDMNMQESRTT